SRAKASMNSSYRSSALVLTNHDVSIAEAWTVAKEISSNARNIDRDYLSTHTDQGIVSFLERPQIVPEVRQ
ncbi:MAG: hypothetical protein ABWX81_11160, partial [Pseudolabrys sp.]